MSLFLVNIIIFPNGKHCIYICPSQFYLYFMFSIYWLNFNEKFYCTFKSIKILVLVKIIKYEEKL